jgi:hypothetical protein
LTPNWASSSLGKGAPTFTDGIQGPTDSPWNVADVTDRLPNAILRSVWRRDDPQDLFFSFTTLTKTGYENSCRPQPGRVLRRPEMLIPCHGRRQGR